LQGCVRMPPRRQWAASTGSCVTGPLSGRRLSSPERLATVSTTLTRTPPSRGTPLTSGPRQRSASHRAARLPVQRPLQPWRPGHRRHLQRPLRPSGTSTRGPLSRPQTSWCRGSSVSVAPMYRALP
jgi:hypothetical protein